MIFVESLNWLWNKIIKAGRLFIISCHLPWGKRKRAQNINRSCMKNLWGIWISLFLCPLLGFHTPVFLLSRVQFIFYIAISRAVVLIRFCSSAAWGRNAFFKRINEKSFVFEYFRHVGNESADSVGRNAARLIMKRQMKRRYFVIDALVCFDYSKQNYIQVYELRMVFWRLDMNDLQDVLIGSDRLVIRKRQRDGYECTLMVLM